MSLLDFLFVTLAANAIVDAWFHGSLFENWRTANQGRLASDETPWSYLWLMLDCQHCFSFHATWLVVLLAVLANNLDVEWLKLAGWTVIYSLAGWRINYLLYKFLEKVLPHG